MSVARNRANHVCLGAYGMQTLDPGCQPTLPLWVVASPRVEGEPTPRAEGMEPTPRAEERAEGEPPPRAEMAAMPCLLATADQLVPQRHPNGPSATPSARSVTCSMQKSARSARSSSSSSSSSSSHLKGYILTWYGIVTANQSMQLQPARRVPHSQPGISSRSS